MMNDPEPWLRTANRVIIGVGLGINTLLLIMRIYTKACLIRKFWWDDGKSLIIRANIAPLELIIDR
jgi:hypothetical protein